MSDALARLIDDTPQGAESPKEDAEKNQKTVPDARLGRHQALIVKANRANFLLRKLHEILKFVRTC